MNTEINSRRSIARRRLGVLLSTLALAVVVLGTTWAHYHAAPSVTQATILQPVTPAKQGAPAPAFAVLSTAGPFMLSAGTKPVVLEIFATWCVGCQQETGVLNRLYHAYGKRVDVIGVSASDTGMDGTSPASVRDLIDFQQRFHIDYPIAFDNTQTVARLYARGGLPTTAIIGRDRRVTAIITGSPSFDDLAARLNAVLK